MNPCDFCTEREPNPATTRRGFANACDQCAADIDAAAAMVRVTRANWRSDGAINLVEPKPLRLAVGE